MARILLAGNRIQNSGPFNYGHLQLVFEDDNGNLTEIEVQSPRTIRQLLGNGLNFVYEGGVESRSHIDPDNTDVGDFSISDAFRLANGGPIRSDEYAAVELNLGDRSAEAVWQLLIEAHLQFADQGRDIDYGFGQNSNSYVNTLLNIIGIELTDALLADATPNDVEQFPGRFVNVIVNPSFDQAVFDPRF